MMLKWVSVIGVSLLAGYAPSSTSQPQAPTSASFAVAIGLTPECLAASGLDATEVGSLLARLDTASESVGALAAATAALDAAIDQIVAMDGRLLTDPGDDETATAREAIVDTLPILQSHMTSARNALIFIGLQGLGSETQTRVERFVSAAGSTLPASMRVFPATGPERRALEAALTAERRASQGGTTVDSSAASILSACRSHPDVVAATVGLSSNLAAIEAVYASGITR